MVGQAQRSFSEMRSPKAGISPDALGDGIIEILGGLACHAFLAGQIGDLQRSLRLVHRRPRLDHDRRRTRPGTAPDPAQRSAAGILSEKA